MTSSKLKVGAVVSLAVAIYLDLVVDQNPFNMLEKRNRFFSNLVVLQQSLLSFEILFKEHLSPSEVRHLIHVSSHDSLVMFSSISKEELLPRDLHSLKLLAVICSPSLVRKRGEHIVTTHLLLTSLYVLIMDTLLMQRRKKLIMVR